MSSAHCVKCGNIYPDRDKSGHPIGIEVVIYGDGSGLCRPCYIGVLPEDDAPACS